MYTWIVSNSAFKASFFDESGSATNSGKLHVKSNFKATIEIKTKDHTLQYADIKVRVGENLLLFMFNKKASKNSLVQLDIVVHLLLHLQSSLGEVWVIVEKLCYLIWSKFVDIL
jgi:hypothetical protein